MTLRALRAQMMMVVFLWPDQRVPTRRRRGDGTKRHETNLDEKNNFARANTTVVERRETRRGDAARLNAREHEQIRSAPETSINMHTRGDQEICTHTY